jgi:site-specific DNA-methyltransferase (adenine-specific)
VSNPEAVDEDEGRAPFSMAGRNPDVLTCIANLSNDEVFTPPELANQMLDTLEHAWSASNGGANIWADSSVAFLDPFTKSGVFLREITKRLVSGLAEEIPDLEDRVDHILTKQVYGIAITELTSLLARRSLYCSKWAMRTKEHPHSIARSFTRDWGNIWFERTEHSWEKGRCSVCRAPKATFGLTERVGMESHAYAFIHTNDINARIAELFGDDVKFDVIIGNPPYQMTGGGGGTNDSAIYHLFVSQAIRLEPSYLSMVIPSRWMAGGRGNGLGDFRAAFLADRRVRTLIDYENAKDVFPTVGIGGGACYFLWERDNPGPCVCLFHRNGQVVGPQERELGEFDVFVRDPRALGILRKVQAAKEASFEELVSGDTPFGLATNFAEYRRGASPEAGEVRVYANVGTTRVTGAMRRTAIAKNTALIDVWKLLLPKTGSGRERERSGVDLVLGPSILAGPESVCTQTYLVAGPLDSQSAAESAGSYLRTRLSRFLVSLRKPSQDVFRSMYRWVPQQTWDRTWTDEELYAKYGITADEQAFIESIIRPMDPVDKEAAATAESDSVG